LFFAFALVRDFSAPTFWRFLAAVIETFFTLDAAGALALALAFSVPKKK
jgi:hypothetical protein